MKVKKIPIKSTGADFLNTVKMIPERLIDVKNASDKQAMNPEKFNVNMISAALHPKKQTFKITKIEEISQDVKSYYFTWSGSQPLAYFRAGQYLTFRLEIDGSIVTRAYSIASSPAKALKGEYQITVKRVNDGFVSGYILDNWKVGDKVDSLAPEGTFVYEPIRDAKTVVALAGGSGITPFLSMARAIDDGTEDFNLTLIYGARNKEEFLFKTELDEIAKRNPNFKPVYVLSDAQTKTRGYEKGFITADIIRKYAPENEKYSIFVCGPEAMYNFLRNEIPTLGIEDKYVRFELFGVSKSTAKLDGIKKGTYKMTVINRSEEYEFTCNGEETILCALERAAVNIPVRCRSGECGFCRSKLVSGTVFLPETVKDKRRMADAKFGYIHPCCTYPTSDIVIKIN